MRRPRFELALERLGPGDWRRFEQFASEFFAIEFQNLRTVATPSGDRGRDAELFSPEADPNVVIQYSVATDWAAKIRDTAGQVRAEFPSALVLVYVTNQEVGAKSDDLRQKVRTDHGLFLDVRDRNWFLERARGDYREELAERLAKDVADPYLGSRHIIDDRPRALTSIEARAAHLFLILQWEDDTREKGLTKLCFEALVRAVLRDTHPDNRLPRKRVQERVRVILSNHPANVIDAYTDSALGRMTKRSIRRYQAADEFCLAHEERERQRDRLAELENQQGRLRDEILAVVKANAEILDVEEGHREALASRTRRVLEAVLSSRGEEFAEAVATSELGGVGLGDLRDRILADLTDHGDEEDVGPSLVDVVELSVTDLVLRPTVGVHRHLRSVADAYTLLAFLRHTPDVQSAVRKLFGHGDIWLDTSIILPLFAEELVDEEGREYTKLLWAAHAAGLKLYITPGVLEEIERHANRALACARINPAKWRGSTPFLLSIFLTAGRPIIGFSAWVERFRGSERPEADVADYIGEFFSIEVMSLEEDMNRAPDEIRLAVAEIWQRTHDRRRSGALADSDLITTQRLVLHDVENYVGVLGKRRGEGSLSFGYSTWLTLDRSAFSVRRELRDAVEGKVPDAPVMSPDFLVNYLAFGPRRGTLPKDAEAALPLALDEHIVEFVPGDLTELAESVRDEAKDLPEHLIRRRIRDRADAARRRRGAKAKGGPSGMKVDLADAISRNS